MKQQSFAGTPIPDGHQPMMTLLWQDKDEMARLQCQSWFDKLRQEFNTGAKLTLDLGLFKYEQQGAQPGSSEHDAAVLAQNVLQSTSASTVDSFANIVRESSRKARNGFFESCLVAVEGHLEVPLHRVYILSTLFKRLAIDLGYSIQGQLRIPVRGENFMLIHDKLVELSSELYGQDESVAYLKHTFDPEHDRAMDITFRGRRFLRALLLEKDSKGSEKISCEVGIPPLAVRCLTRPTAMNGKVLGWLEHIGEGQFFIRAIAMASVDFVMPDEN